MKKSITIITFYLFFYFLSIDLMAHKIETGGGKEVRKKFLYFLSFPLNHIQYKINKDISWWSEIEEGLVLGAMPLNKAIELKIGVRKIILEILEGRTAPAKKSIERLTQNDSEERLSIGGLSGTLDRLLVGFFQQHFGLV